MDNLLQSGGIGLRALEPGDIDLLYQWENDTTLWEVSNSHTPFSRHLLAQYLKEATRDIYEQKQLRMIIQTNEGKPVGAVDLFDFDPYHQRAGVGILVYKQSERGCGYASNALSALEKYAIHALGLRQLYANIAEDNSISIGLFNKAGYVVTGIKKMWLRRPTGWIDEWLLQKILT